MEAQLFQQSLLATMTAFTPVTAVRTSEVDTVITETLNFALTAVPEHRDANGRTAKVFVWRMSEGFREYHLYIPMNHSNSDKRGMKIVTVEGPEDSDLQMAIPQKSRDVIEIDDDESEGHTKK